MTDEQKPDSPPDVRRVSQKDRKANLDTGRLVFPPDSPLPESNAGEPPPPEAPPVSPPPVDSADRYPPLNPDARPQRRAGGGKRSRRSYFWYNVGTVFFTLGGCGLFGYFLLIALNPFTPLNPLPPFTPLPVIVTTTPLPPTPSITPSLTPTLIPSATPSFTPLPAELLPTRPTFTPAPFPFTISNQGVTYDRNRTAEGCDWVSIAGAVSGLGGEILNGYGVRIQGEGIDETIYTGGASTLAFGAGEFELVLGDTPAIAPYLVSLYSPEGEILSDEYLVVTSDQCSQNVAQISFVQNRAVD